MYTKKKNFDSYFLDRSELPELAHAYNLQGTIQLDNELIKPKAKSLYYGYFFPIPIWQWILIPFFPLYIYIYKPIQANVLINTYSQLFFQLNQHLNK